MNRFGEMSIEQRAIIAKAFQPLQDMAEEMRKTLKPTLDAMKLLSNRECATSLRKRRSHRNYCQVRAESIYGLKPTLAEVAAQWVNRTIQIQEPPNEVLSSSLRIHGPPLRNGSRAFLFDSQPAPVGLGQGEPSR